jgi:SRSO17 transposase
MAEDIEARFERYCDMVVSALAHADRREPACWYLKGLMLPGGRKSIEPMAARVHPEDVRSAHQSMHHVVADSEWSDATVLGAVADRVLPELFLGDASCFWIVDDTGFPKKGVHSVGVARQYCGRLGKIDNCQVAVSLSLGTERGSLPIDYRLYLPREWAEDPTRRQAAKVPIEIEFATKGDLALVQIETALAAGRPRGIVLADAAYGDEAAFRDRLSALEMIYAAGVRPGTAVFWGEHQPALPSPPRSGGQPTTRLVRDAAHPPLSVLELAQRLSAKCFRQVTWREGVAGALCSRFARVRVRAAHGDRARAEEWLLIEWPKGEVEPTHYWLSTLPQDTTLKQLVATTKARWRIEHDYLELKSELGLDHFEGRGWRGFHHHASLCIAAYGFLILERLSGLGKKNAARFQEPPLPKGFRPRGARADAAPLPLVHRHHALPAGACHRPCACPMPLLRPAQHKWETQFLTQ